MSLFVEQLWRYPGKALALERGPEVLKDIGRRFRGRIALNADVLRPDTVSVGDRVELVLPVAATIDA